MRAGGGGGGGGHIADDINIDVLVGTMPSTWRFGTSIRTGRAGVRIPRLSMVASFSSSFYFSASVIVRTAPSPQSICMILEPEAN